MNKKSYRVVFNKQRGMLMAVAETVTPQGKGQYASRSPAGSKNLALLQLAGIVVSIAALFGSVTMVHAQIVADPNAAGNRRPVIDTTANGRPLVQIATPNAAGISHNQYNRFNVDANGALLNNARTAVPTQLGGYVGANPNLGNSAARIILNEVTGPSATWLRGYTEVAGQRAEVIIANPNGISCDGCGFINTSRGVLTTGTPIFGGDGSLEAFRVTRGDIQIFGAGLIGANTDQLDLIARSVQVNSELWAKNLNVITGANQVRYADLGVQVLQGDGTKPTVGIDVAQLGGMYANKIRLVGTEAGVGVNTLGNIAAQAGDLQIDAQGKVTLAGRTEATGQLTINGNDDVVNSGTLYGQQAVVISGQGQITNRGTAATQGDLSLEAAAVDSTGSLGAGVDADGKVTQGGNLRISAAGAITAGGANVAGGNVAITGTSINLAGAQTAAGGSTSLSATAGDINHANASLQSGAATTLAATGAINNDSATINTGELSIDSASLSNKGGKLLQSGNSDVRIIATGTVDNSGGTIVANGNQLHVQAASLANSQGKIEHAGAGVLKVQIGGVDNSDGSIATNGQLNLVADSVGNERGNLFAAGKANVVVAGGLFNNQGNIQSGAALNIAAGTVDNTAGRMVSLGADGFTLSSAGSFINGGGTTVNGDEGGVIGGNGNVTVTATVATNSGRIIAAGDLSATVDGTFSNNNGRLVAGHAITVDAARFANAAGSVDAAQVSLLIPQLDNTGGNITADQLQVSAANLTNQHGKIVQYGSGVTTIAVSGALDNSNGGLIQTNGADLSLAPHTIDNRSGTIAHAGTGTLTIDLAGDFAGSGGTISSNGQVDVTAASIDNQGGMLFGQRTTSVRATDGGIDNSANGYLGGRRVAATANNGQVNNAGGTIEATEDGIAINAQSLANAAGRVQNLGIAAVDITTTQDISNTVANGTGGIIGSEGTVNIVAGAIDNTGGTLFGKDDLTLHSNGDLVNTGGSLRTMADANIVSEGAVRNDGGRIEANGATSTLEVSGSSIDNAGGRIVNAGNGLTQVASGSHLINTHAASTVGMGIIGGNGDVAISAADVVNTQGGKIIAGNNLTVDATGSVNNNGGANLGASGDIKLSAANVDNSSGQIGTLAYTGGNVVIDAGDNIINTAGLIGSDHDLRLTANTIDGVGRIMAGHDATLDLRGDYNNAAGTTLQADRHLILSATGNLTNAGAIRAVDTLTINAANITNRTGGDLNSANTILSANSGNGDIANAGSIGGDTVTATSNRLDNTGAVIGGDITVNANSVSNYGNAAVIAATNKVNLFVKNSLVNADGALIYSLGGLSIAADNARDINGNFLHKTQQLTNSSATIETDGDLIVGADSITNKRTTLQIQRDIYDGSASWSKYNYYWRSWGPGMTGPDSAGLMAPVTKTLPFNDPAAYNSQYGSILQVDTSTNRALIQFQGTNQLWVYYKDIKKNHDNTYAMTFYEGAYCPGYGELCPYQHVVYREYAGRPVVDQFDPNRFTSPAELQNIGINGESAYDFRERSFNGSAHHDELVAASAAAKMAASGKIVINTNGLTNDASNITAGGAIAINGAAASNGSGGVVTNRGYSINRTEIGTTVDHYDRHVGHHSYTTLNETKVTSLSTIDANIQSNQGVSINARTINNATVNAAQSSVGGNSLGSNQGGSLTPSGNSHTTTAANGVAGSGASVPGTSRTVGSATVPLPNLTLPQNGLFSVHPEPGQRYLVETDPRFTNYRRFLSSDYMLGRLAMDPAKVQKRLGDGFYEQKVINDQIAELSGKRFLDGYASAEEQFKALMDSGVVIAKQFNLTPGIALTGEQMAALTRDIVWMVDQELTLPDGSRQHALVPVVYLAQTNHAQLKPSGALIGGQDVALDATETIRNSGIMKAKGALLAQANVIDNTGGELRGDKIVLKGTQQLTIGTDFQSAGRQGSVRGRDVSLEGGDIQISGAKVAATESLVIQADNNLTVGSATAQRSTTFEWSKAGNTAADHGLMRNGGVSAEWMQVQGSNIESGGDLAMRAGKDVSIKGSSVAAAGQAGIVAGGQVNIEADKNITSNHVTGRSDRYHITAKGYSETVVGSSVEGGKGVTIIAQGKNGSNGDVNIVASNVSSAEGQTIIGAAGSLSIGAATQRRSNDLLETAPGARIKTDEKSVTSIGSHVGGENGVTLVAQGSANSGRVDIIGSDVTSNGQIKIAAKDTVNIAESRTQTEYERTSHRESKGFLSKKTSDSYDHVVEDTANGSTISGDQVTIQSGKDINVIGSSIVATQDVSLDAKDNVQIAAAQSTTRETHIQREKKSGLASSSAGIGISIGSSERKSNFDGVATTESQNRSAVGTASGNLIITSGKDTTIKGSDLIAGKAEGDMQGATGHIDIQAQNINIEPGKDSSRTKATHEAKQSGVSVALVGTPLDTSRNLKDAQKNPSKFGRARATLDEIAFSSATVPQVAVNFDRSKSSSQVTTNDLVNTSSSLAAAGDIRLRATGNGTKDAAGKAVDGDITVTGSFIGAGGTAMLDAERNITLQASTDHYQESIQASSSKTHFSTAMPSPGDMGRAISGGPNNSGAGGFPYGKANTNDTGESTASTQTATLVSGNNVVLNSRTGDIRIAGSGLDAVEDIDVIARQGRIDITSGQDSSRHQEEHSSHAVGDLGSNAKDGSMGTGFTVGVRREHSTLDTTQTQQSTIRSQLSAGGNITLDAKEDITATGTDLRAGRDITAIGKNINLDPGQDAVHTRQSSEMSQVGVTTSTSGYAVEAAKALEQAAKAVEQKDDKRLAALYGAKAALTMYNGMGMPDSVSAANLQSRAMVEVTTSIGSSSAESKSENAATQNMGSTLTAGETVTLIATGSGQKDAAGKAMDGDISARGTIISGTNVVLTAARDINLQSAQDITHDRSSDSSRNASIGVGFALGGQQNGFTLELAASKAKGKANGDSITHQNTVVTASDTVVVNSGRDTNLNGGQVRGDTVIANIGRNLNIASQQDTDTYHSKQESTGVSASICVPPFCYGTTVEASANIAKANTDSTYQSVKEQSGLYAGKGGFDVTVNGNTDLKGAVIASAAEASKNKLVTGTLTTSDIENKAEYKSDSSSLSLSYAGGSSNPNNTITTPGGIKPDGTSAPGSALQTLGSNIATNAAGNAIAAKEGSVSGTTKSAVSAGTIVIANEAGQLATTGKTADETIAGLNRDTGTANGSIEKIFDLKKLQQEQEYQKVLSEVAQQAAPIVYKQVGDTLVGQPTEVKVAVHALMGGLMSKAIGGEFGSGAAGAAAATLAVESFGEEVRRISGLSKEDKDALILLMGQAVGQLAAAGAGASAKASNAAGATAKLATEHNYLKHQEILDLTKARKECNGGKGSVSACGEVKRLEALDKRRDADLSACSGNITAHCDELRKEVRSAYAEIIRKSDETFGLFTPAPMDYKAQADKSLFQADKTISTLDRVKGGGIGLWDSVVDGIAGVVKGGVIYVRAVGGDIDAQDTLGRTIDDVGRVASTPELWEKILTNATKESREKIADAYERGDGVALGRIAGEALSNLVGGGAGTTRKVGALAEDAAKFPKITKGGEPFSRLSQAGGLEATEGNQILKANGQLSNPTHPLAKHGPDVTDQYIYDRVGSELANNNRTGLRTAFNERTQMERAIAETFAQKQAEIDAWLASGPRAGVPKAFDANPGMGNLGRGFEITTSGGPIVPITRPMPHVNLVLIPDGRGGFLIHTAHPY